MNAFSTCEHEAMVDGEMNKDIFVSCFKAQRVQVESMYPHAFDFMDDGFSFLLFMFGVYFLYSWVVSPKIDKLIGTVKPDKEEFNYAEWVKNFGKTAYNAPVNTVMKISEKIKEGL